MPILDPSQYSLPTLLSALAAQRPEALAVWRDAKKLIYNVVTNLPRTAVGKIQRFGPEK